MRGGGAGERMDEGGKVRKRKLMRCCGERSTGVVVGHPLGETRLLAARRGLDSGGELAQVRFADVQGEICRCAQFDLRAPLVVL